MKLVYLLGTDGAGKSSVARQVAAEGITGRRVKYLYCQHRPMLIWLLKLPARLLFMRKTDEFKDYAAYKRTKQYVVGRQPVVASLYARFLYFDVWLQTWPRLLWARWTGDVVVLDRYYLDWVVNVGVLQGNGRDDMLREARKLEWTLPRADIHLFLDVDEQTAFQRKSDIQSVEYLRERKQRYNQLAVPYDFIRIDATQPLMTVVSEVRQLVAKM